MKIAVIGAGAIGGLVGARLALAGEDVTFIVRGANLDAIRKNGIELIATDGQHHVAHNVRATDRYDEAGPQDLVILAVKAHQVDAVVDDLHTLFHDETVVIPMQNGIPFWYFQRHGGELEGRGVDGDPGGVVNASDPRAGSSAAWCTRPASRRRPASSNTSRPALAAGGAGWIAHRAREQDVGRLDRAGFEAQVIDDIRDEIWLKVWGNLSFNPVCGADAFDAGRHLRISAGA